MSINQFSQVRSHSQEIDAGLRAHMSSIYNRMSLGIAITAITAWFVASTPALFSLLMGGPQAYIFMFAPLAIIWFGFNPATMSSQKLKATFIGLSVVYGISFSTIAMFFAGADIARAFFVTAGVFSALSIFGYTTKKNLAPIGTFCFMALLGIILVSLVGLFFEYSSTFNMFLDIAIVLVVSGLTAWETQAAKEMYSQSHGTEMNSRLAWSSALSLYINFIIMFSNILSLMQER